jgi:hypothetical protein
MITAETNRTTDSYVNKLLERFKKATGFSDISYEIKQRSDQDVLVIYLANPTERFFRILEEIVSSEIPDGLFPIHATLKKKANSDLHSAESRLLLRTLSESLTINRYSFADDFFGRYIKSVSGAEEQITSSGNHVVFGRRGSGKSSLLLYAMHKREDSQHPFAWIDMQVYKQRNDNGVVASIFRDILDQADPYLNNGAAEALKTQIDRFVSENTEIPDLAIRKWLPDLKRLFATLASRELDFTIFLDDFHVLDQQLQPKLLDFLYGFARGNRVHLKLSAIETFTKLHDAATNIGLEIPHDAQSIKLDYNLTIADKATEHIKSILDSHANYCGLPSINILCKGKQVLSRLVWISAGVPRDALNIFSQGMTKAVLNNQPRVTVTNINVAASETINGKLRDIELDASGVFTDANETLNKIKDFCIKNKKSNAFLVHIQHSDPIFESVRKLIDLRLLHVIHEGITKREAGRKYLALILDYGFYTGIRATRSVELFNENIGVAKYNELKDLPIFSV